MGYIDSNLMAKEQIVHKAKIHWMVYLPAMSLFAAGLILFWAESESPGAAVGGMIAVTLSIIYAIKALIQKVSTELAVTSKRIIAKFGLIRRNTIELNHAKVESFHVNQSILGRIFGFGTVVINGTGGVQTPIPNIDGPLEFRKQAMAAIDASQG